MAYVPLPFPPSVTLFCGVGEVGKRAQRGGGGGTGKEHPFLLVYPLVTGEGVNEALQQCLVLVERVPYASRRNACVLDR